MYNLIEYSDNYSKTLESLWQYYSNEPVLNNASVIVDFTGNDTSDSFDFKQKITGQTDKNDTKMLK